MAEDENEQQFASHVRVASASNDRKSGTADDPGNGVYIADLSESPYSALHTGPYDPEKHRDWVRSITTYAFIGILAITVLGALFTAIWRGTDWPQIKEFLQLALPAETALIGSVVGFYFGSQARRDQH